MSHESWMSSECIASKSIFDVTIPGTHDAGAYWLSSKLVPGDMPENLEALIYAAEEKFVHLDEAITTWGTAQDMDFYQQLSGGIRYFDLRCGYDVTIDTWRTFHMEFGLPLDILLNQIHDFLSSHPSEFVIIEMSHFEGYPTMDNITSLADMTSNIFGSMLVPSSYSIADMKEMSIGSLVDELFQVYVTFENDDIASSYDGLHPSSDIYNTYANSCDRDVMIPFNYDQVNLFQLQTIASALFKVSWTLTPHAECIIDGIKPEYPWGLLDLADTVNGVDLNEFIGNVTAMQARPGNILIIDHFESSQIVSLMIQVSNC